MDKKEFNELALTAMRLEHNSVERALARLDEVEGECFQTGRLRLIPKIDEARKFLQRYSFDF